MLVMAFVVMLPGRRCGTSHPGASAVAAGLFNNMRTDRARISPSGRCGYRREQRRADGTSLLRPSGCSDDQRGLSQTEALQNISPAAWYASGGFGNGGRPSWSHSMRGQIRRRRLLVSAGSGDATAVRTFRRAAPPTCASACLQVLHDRVGRLARQRKTPGRHNDRKCGRKYGCTATTQDNMLRQAADCVSGERYSPRLPCVSITPSDCRLFDVYMTVASHSGPSAITPCQFSFKRGAPAAHLRECRPIPALKSDGIVAVQRQA